MPDNLPMNTLPPYWTLAPITTPPAGRPYLTPTFNPSSGPGINWNNLFNQGFGLLNNFFGARYAAQSAPYTGVFAPPSAVPGSVPAASVTAAQLEAERLRLEREREELASGSISGKGIKIGDTVITWPTIALAGVGLYLIQHRGFTRR